MSKNFFCIKEFICLRESAKYSWSKSSNYFICHSRDRVWFMQIYRNSQYPSCNSNGEWYIATFWEDGSWFFSHDYCQRLEYAYKHLKWHDKCLEWEISSEFAADNRGEWYFIFSCDLRFYAFSFANPVKRRFWIVFSYVVCEIDKREDMSPSTTTDEYDFFSILHFYYLLGLY